MLLAVVHGLRAGARQRGRARVVIEVLQRSVAQLAVEGQPLIMQFGAQSGEPFVQWLTHPGDVKLLQRLWQLVGGDQFGGQMPMLMAVVKIDFAGLQALAHLAVDPELVAVGLHAGGVAIGVKRQQVRPQTCRHSMFRALVNWPLRQPLLFRKNFLHPRKGSQPRAVGIDAGRLKHIEQRAKVAPHACGQPALRAQGIKTLAALTVRIPRRRRWWTAVPGLGATGARKIEAFFALHPQLTERAWTLVASASPQDVIPWERLAVPHKVDGSRGTFRAPRANCTLDADNDYEAVQAWLALHESPATRAAYRKEAERLILWAIVERGRALSSLSTEDAVAYRSFLRHPSPRGRWVGPPRPRSAPEWRPFAGGLSARSAAYSLSVLGALYRWLIQQRYLLANPFAGLKVRGAGKSEGLSVTRAFSEGEWSMIRAVAEGLEMSYGWEPTAAQRLRFVIDFAYATGLRASELVGARLGMIEEDARGERWLHLVGKGSKAGSVALPPMARTALDRYLAQRKLPTTPSRWDPATPLLGSLDQDSAGGITASRLWAVMKRFFAVVADIVRDQNPSVAEKLRRAK